jgi:hypothetical protein
MHSFRPPAEQSALPSLNISGPSVERAAFTVTLSESVEIEAKFFLPRRILHSLIAGREGIAIEQHYFPRSETRKLAREFSLFVMVEDSHEFSSARVRKATLPSGKESFQIDFKGKKDEVQGSRIYRREFGLEISQTRFKQLRKEALEGSIVKIRHDFGGYIIDRGRRIPVVAQVDHYKAAGSPLAELKTEFATVDIEIPKAELIQALRRGDHSFSFLKECVELSTQSEDLQRALATRRLAKFGFDAERLTALEEIKEIAKKLRKK